MARWNEGQQLALAIVPKFTSVLSFLGSLWIIIEVCTRKEKLDQVYHRLLLAMSIYDVLESGWNFASTWPIPAGAPDVWGASGTIQTCVAQGFFLQLGLAIPIYNASLSVYYYLVIHCGMSEEKLRKKVEPAFHSVAFSFPMATACASIGLDLFNNANLWCWIAEFPKGCNESYMHGRGNGNCIRGDNAFIYRWAFYFGPLWFCMLMALVTIMLVYRSVYKRESATAKYRRPHVNFHGQQQQGTAENASPAAARRRSLLEFVHDWQKKQRRKLRENPRSREVFWQAVWYLVAFFMTHLFSTINRALQQSGRGSPFAVVLLHSFFDPLQGFMNFIVYRRPRYRFHRKRKRTRIESLRRTLRWTFLGAPEHQVSPRGGVDQSPSSDDEEDDEASLPQRVSDYDYDDSSHEESDAEKQGSSKHISVDDDDKNEISAEEPTPSSPSVNGEDAATREPKLSSVDENEFSQDTPISSPSRGRVVAESGLLLLTSSDSTNATTSMTNSTSPMRFRDIVTIREEEVSDMTLFSESERQGMQDPLNPPVVGKGKQ